MAEDSSSDFEGITWPDYLVIVAYFLFVLAVGLYVSQADLGERDAISEFILISVKFGMESRRAAYKFFNKPEGNTRPESDKPTSRKQCSRLD